MLLCRQVVALKWKFYTHTHTHALVPEFHFVPSVTSAQPIKTPVLKLRWASYNCSTPGNTTHISSSFFLIWTHSCTQSASHKTLACHSPKLTSAVCWLLNFGTFAVLRLKKACDRTLNSTQTWFIAVNARRHNKTQIVIKAAQICSFS